MQSSKTSKQSRKNVPESAVAPTETVSVREAKSTGRVTRSLQSKKTVELVPAAAKSHRKMPAQSTSTSLAKVSVAASSVETEAAQPVPVKVMAATVGTSITPSVSHEEIEELAYSYWVARNFAPGDPKADWHRAAAQLLQTL